MSKLQTRTTRFHLTPDTIFHECAFSIEIDDEGGGEFLVIRSCTERGSLSVDVDEWPALRDAIDFMSKNVRAEE